MRTHEAEIRRGIRQYDSTRREKFFSTSGYFETTRSPSHLVFEAGWPGTSFSRRVDTYCLI